MNGYLKKSTSNTNCCVYGCKSVHKRNPELSFHLFPKLNSTIQYEDAFGAVSVTSRRKLWVIKLRIGRPVTSNMRVCQRHFLEEDYQTPGDYGYAHRFLKKTAVPSQNLPESSTHAHNELQNQGRQKRYENMIAKRIVIQENNHPDTVEETPGVAGTADLEAAEGLLLLGETDTKMVALSPSFADAATQTDVSSFGQRKEVGCQANSPDLLTVAEYAQTDKALRILTGIATFSLLNLLVELLDKFQHNGRCKRLTNSQKIFLTFMKIKLDLTYSALGVFFGGISISTCKRIFLQTVESLSDILKDFIDIPSKQNVLENLPKCFENYRHVRLVLDCTEIRVQAPKKLCCRVKFYSHYKKNYTLKFMTAVTPAGLIGYISSAFGGRASDKAIFEQSRLVERLEPYIDQLMVDKGFLIDGICEEYGIKLLRPEFRKKKKKFSREESLNNKAISSARVHVERVNARIKVFRLLRNTFPLHLLGIVDEILTVVCAIVNLSTPILRDDLFL